MKRVLLLSMVLLLSACHTTPRVSPPTITTDRVQVDDTGALPAGIEVASPSPDVSALQNQTPPCLQIPIEPKHAAKPHAPPVLHPAPAAPEPATPALASGGEPTVKSIANISLSVLGKKVRGAKGEDLGRLVDLLADAHGRVRVAIIESGGFLGVGNRRIAVDWSLLKFHPDPNDSYVMLVATAKELQGTPEYKESHEPVGLMAPNDSTPAANRP
jgi:hypothetical protein